MQPLETDTSSPSQLIVAEKPPVTTETKVADMVVTEPVTEVRPVIDTQAQVPPKDVIPQHPQPEESVPKDPSVDTKIPMGSYEEPKKVVPQNLRPKLAKAAGNGPSESNSCVTDTVPQVGPSGLSSMGLKVTAKPFSLGMKWLCQYCHGTYPETLKSTHEGKCKIWSTRRTTARDWPLGIHLIGVAPCRRTQQQKMLPGCRRGLVHHYRLDFHSVARSSSPRRLNSLRNRRRFQERQHPERLLTHRNLCS